MAASDASKHDLTSELGKFLDRHLVFPLLEFLQAKKVYPEAEILEAKIALLQKTNMLDFAADIYKSLHNAKDVPPESVLHVVDFPSPVTPSTTRLNNPSSDIDCSNLYTL